MSNEIFTLDSLLDEQINENPGKIVRDYHQSQVILLIVEDQTYGYQYIKKTMKKLYGQFNTFMVQMHGRFNMKNAQDFAVEALRNRNIHNIDLQVIIYDYGTYENLEVGNSAELHTKESRLRALQIRQKNMGISSDLADIQSKLIIFRPNAFEELLLSFKGLDILVPIRDVQSSKLWLQYIELLNGQIHKIDFVKLLITQPLKFKQVEQLIEYEAESILKGTYYIIQHSSGKLGVCWTQECGMCDRRSCKISTVHSYHEDKAVQHSGIKLDEINTKGKIDCTALNQLQYLLYRKIDQVFGFKYRQNKLLESVIIDNILNNGDMSNAIEEVK